MSGDPHLCYSQQQFQQMTIMDIRRKRQPAGRDVEVRIIRYLQEASGGIQANGQ